MIFQRKSPFTAALFFLGFVLAGALKVAVFDHLIVDEPALSSIAAGFLNKAAVMFLVCLLLTLPRRPFLFIGFYCLQLLYMYVNLLYHFSFMGYLHISQYTGLYGEAFDLARHSALPADGRLLWVFLDLPFLIGLLWTFPGFSRIATALRARTALYGLAAILLLFCMQWDPQRDTAAALMNNAYESDISVVQKYGLLTFNIVDLLNYRDGQEHIRGISYGPVVTSAAASVSGDTVEAMQRPNIVVLQVESLDAYIVDRKYKDAYITPFFHGLTSASVYYPYMLSYHEAGSTSDCEFSTINSIEPFEDYPSIKIRNYDYVNSMARQASLRGGYAVKAFHGNRGSYFNRAAAFKKMGFDRFFDIDTMGLQVAYWGAPDKAVFDFVAIQLRSQREPFFYYVITMSSHEPFTLTQSYYQNNFFSDIRNERTRDYFNAISYVDREVGEFVRMIRQIRPNTYVFIFGDHTPVIARDVYKRAFFVYDARQFEFVPLFIITPDSLAFRENRYAASFIDIAPTVLAATRAPYSIRTSGANLLSHPIANTAIDYRGASYLRADLYKRIKQGK
jgi:lipoteichoic acid synthase